MNSLQKVIKDYKSIKTTKDLAKRNLTFYELIVIEECIREINNKGYAINFISKVTEYFSKFGFVIEKYQGVNWKIINPNN